MKVFFIDSQSYHNLSIYDYRILSRISLPVHFFGSKLYDYKSLPENIYFTKTFNYSLKKNSIAKSLSYAFSMLTILFFGIKERPRIYHFQWTKIFYIDYIVPYLLKKLFQSKIIFTVHNILPRERNQNTVKRFKKLYRFCDYLIAHTDTTKKELINQFEISPDKIIVMPHGLLDINVDNLKYEKCLNQFRNSLDVKDKLLISLLGTQSYYKGTDLLVDAWSNSALLSKNEKVQLIIAGKSNLEKEFENLPENIKILNRILSNEEFKALIKLSDLIVLPYREIDQSGFLLSILNECVPYCSTNVGELTAPLTIADIGWDLGSPDEKSIAKALELIVQNPTVILSKKENIDGWNKIHIKLGWDSSVNILRTLYKELLTY